MARKKDREQHLLRVESIFLALYDVGRSIDIPKALGLLGAGKGKAVRMGRDTPDYMSLPQPLVIDLFRTGEKPGAEGESAIVKLYGDGAITIIARSHHRVPVERIWSIRDVPFGARGEKVGEFTQRAFTEMYARVERLVDHRNYPADPILKTYTAYCVVDEVEAPASFVTAHARELGALLIDGTDDATIHDSQIANTLSHPFSYRAGEIAVFDFDRCFIIDPKADYEDILLVAEHANYQLLELRQLDLLLDNRLEVAETDMRTVFMKEKRLPSFTSLGKKLAEIQALRLDALFLLENLENSSKIIGDYHLGRIYTHLCDIFNTSSWRWSVERRLETLQGIYELARGDVNDRTMRFLEIVFILVCVFQVFQMFFIK